MLQRLFIHLSLVLLFAFTQIGSVTHELSHFLEQDKQHQQEKSSNGNQCETCISFTHIADNHLTSAFVFTVNASPNVFSNHHHGSFLASPNLLYSVRAPPQHSQS